MQCSAIAQSELIQLLVPGSGLFRNCVQSEVPEFVYRSGTHLSQALHSASLTEYSMRVLRAHSLAPRPCPAAHGRCQP